MRMVADGRLRLTDPVSKYLDHWPSEWSAVEILNEQKTIDIVGAGDLVSTAEDLATFDAAFDDDRFLPAALRGAMLAPHVEGPNGTSLGYGWFVRTSDAGRLVQYHNGGGAGFRAFNYRLPGERLSIVILSNVDERTYPWLAPLVDRIAEVAGER